MKNRISYLEFRRKFFHMLIILFFVLLLYLDLLDEYILLSLLILSILFFPLYKKIKPMRIIFEKTERKKNMKFYPGVGSINFLIGAALAYSLFTKEVALASLIIMAVGDGLAPLIGQYGKVRYSVKKSLEGIVMASIFAAFAASIFVKPMFAFAASVVSMLLEGLDLSLKERKIDDNIFIPLVSGIILTLLI